MRLSLTSSLKKKTVRIGFIHNAFPLVSETFISKEMTGLTQLGLDLEIYSLFRPGDHNRDRSFKEPRPIFYLLDTLRIFHIVKAHLFFLFLFPLRYAATAIFVLRQHDGDVRFFSLLRSCGSGREISKEQRQDIRLHFLLAAPLALQMHRDRITFINSHFADAAASFAMLCARLLDLDYAVTAHAYDIFTQQSQLQTKLNHAKFILTCTHYNREILNPQTKRNVLFSIMG